MPPGLLYSHQNPFEITVSYPLQLVFAALLSSFFKSLFSEIGASSFFRALFFFSLDFRFFALPVVHHVGVVCYLPFMSTRTLNPLNDEEGGFLPSCPEDSMISPSKTSSFSSFLVLHFQRPSLYFEPSISLETPVSSSVLKTQFATHQQHHGRGSDCHFFLSIFLSFCTGPPPFSDRDFPVVPDVACCNLLLPLSRRVMRYFFFVLPPLRYRFSPSLIQQHSM